MASANYTAKDITVLEVIFTVLHADADKAPDASGKRRRYDERVRQLIVLALVLLAAGCTPAPQPPPLACDVSAPDRAWMERAIAAWRFSAREITGVRPQGDFGAVFFDGACVLTSPNALSAANDATATWTAAPHAGTVTLPNGDDMTAGVRSARRNPSVVSDRSYDRQH